MGWLVCLNDGFNCTWISSQVLQSPMVDHTEDLSRVHELHSINVLSQSLYSLFCFFFLWVAFPVWQLCLCSSLFCFFFISNCWRIFTHVQSAHRSSMLFIFVWKGYIPDHLSQYQKRRVDSILSFLFCKIHTINARTWTRATWVQDRRHKIWSTLHLPTPSSPPHHKQWDWSLSPAN